MAAGKTDGIRSTGNRAARWRIRPALEKHPNKIIGRKARSEEVAGLVEMVEIDRKTGPIGIPIHDGKRTKRAGPGPRQRQNQEARDQPDAGQNQRAPQNGAQKENPGRIEDPSKEQPPRRGTDRRAGAKTKTGRATQERGGLLREWGCSAGRLAGGCGGYGLYTATRVDGRPRYAPPRPRRRERSTNEPKAALPGENVEHDVFGIKGLSLMRAAISRETAERIVRNLQGNTWKEWRGTSGTSRRRRR